MFARFVLFLVSLAGYEYPADGFGFRGLAVTPQQPHTLFRVNMTRTQVAQRVYRLTGLDIYRDSVLLNNAAAASGGVLVVSAGGSAAASVYVRAPVVDVPVTRPLVNDDVVGQDSILTALYKGTFSEFMHLGRFL